MMDPLMSPAEFHDHQRRALRQIREQEMLEKRRQNVEDTLKAIEVIKDEKQDPYYDLFKPIPWAIGAFLAVLVFVALAFWAYVEWQPKLDLSFKGPAHYSRSGK